MTDRNRELVPDKWRKNLTGNKRKNLTLFEQNNNMTIHEIWAVKHGKDVTLQLAQLASFCLYCLPIF